MSKTCNTGCEPEPEVYLAKVKSINANVDPDCADLQPAHTTPFYDETLPNRFLIIPEVGLDFVLEVSSAIRFTPNQWVYVDGVGKFKVKSILSNTKLVVENTGINADATPGKQYHGVRKVWVTEPKEESDEELSIDRLEANLANESFDFCVATEDILGAENGNPIGAIVPGGLCEPCTKESASTKVKRCLKTFPNIVFKWLTMALPLMPKTSLSFVEYKKSGVNLTNPLLPVLWHPQYGDLYTKNMPNTGAVDAYTPDGVSYALVPGTYGTNFFALSANQETGKPEFRKLDFNTTQFIGAALANGSVNIKTMLETALGITLPSTGEVYVGIYAFLGAINQSATFDGGVIAATGAADTYAAGNRTFAIDLSSPSVIVGAQGTFTLDLVHLPVSYLLNPA